MKHRFILISRWQLGCGVDAAWQRVSRIRRWPQWWPNVRSVTVADSTDDTPRVGGTALIDWKTRLGYGLRLRVTTTSLLKPFELEGQAEGDLTGRGLWVLESLDQGTEPGVRVTYRWDVHLNRAWMRLCAPLLRPLFAWNHFDVMRAGAHAMARDIGCPLLRYEDYTFTPGSAVEDLRALNWPEKWAPSASPPTRK
jgi:hypothetical protein